MRNTQLIDKRFNQMESKMKVLKFLLSRQLNVDQFKSELDSMDEILADLKSLIERNLDPLRNG